MKHRGNSSKLILGIVIVIAGFLFLFNSLGLISSVIAGYIFSWQTLLLAIGVIAVSNYGKNVVGWILIILGGGFLLADIANLSADFNEIFWPTIIIIIGVAIIFKGSYRRFPARFRQGIHHSSEVADNETFEDVAIFGGGNKSYDLTNLRSGNIVAIFGGSDLDLSRVTLAEEGAVIEVFNMFGGSTLWVPAEWSVRIDVVSIFGGFDEKKYPGKSPTDETKTLYIKGMTLFGGGELKRK